MSTQTDTTETERGDVPPGSGEHRAETQPTRGGPNYPLARVGAELPEEPAAGRSRLYFDLLTTVKNDEDQPNDEWYAVAEFVTPTGANDAYKAISEGQRAIPVGRWSFEARRGRLDGSKGSTLYAKYLGAVEDDEEPDGPDAE